MLDPTSVRIAAVAIFAALMLPGECAAQSGTLGLRDIVHGPYDKPGDPAKPPDDAIANSRGGYVEVTMLHSDKTADRLWASWVFDRDVSSLRAGDEIGVTLRTGIREGNSDAVHYWISAVNLHESRSSLLEERGRIFDDWSPAIFGGLVRYAYAREGYGTPVGRLDGKLTVDKNIQKGKTTGFVVNLNATARGSSKAKPTSGHYEWLYLFDVNGPGRPNVEVKIGNPDIPVSLQPKLTRGTPGTRTTTGGNDSDDSRRNDTSGHGNSGGTADTSDSGGGSTLGRNELRPPFDDHIIRTGPELPDDLPSDVARGPILQANRVRVKQGDTVRVRVDLWNAVNISNMNFALEYDSQVAQPTETPIKGSLLSGVRLEANPGGRSVLVGFADESGINGTGSVVYVPFRAVGRPGDRTVVSPEITTVNDPDGGTPSVYTIPGEILIVDEDGFQPGDANGDGEINELDALDALKMSVRLIPIQLQADVDNNGEVTSRDATLIMQRVRQGN